MKTKYLTLRLMSKIMLILTVILTSCGGSEDTPDVTPSKVSITLPAEIKALPGETVSLQGSGVVVNAKLTFVSKVNSSLSYLANIDKVEGGNFTFVLPATITTGDYSVMYSKGTDKVTVGDTRVNTEKISVPDVAGMTIKGCVMSNGVGISGVAVTDGVEVTATDANGVYYLASQKASGLVYITVPANYEMKSSINSSPKFFARLTEGASTSERHDFELVPSDNDNHVVLTMTDMHLANRNNDIAQYENGFLPDINATIAKYKAEGKKVYGINMGDTSWDAYWYSNKYTINEAVGELKKVNCNIYSAMGNHDNDPYVADDILASLPYRNVLCPTYYSFNIGKVHYIVLDDIKYNNVGASQGTIGDRKYDDVVTADQIKWLKKDMALITDKSTPIVVVMHAQLYSAPSVSNGVVQNPTYSLNNGTEVVSYFTGYTDVRFITGHTHVNYSAQNAVNKGLYEYNTAAVCATWWWTGKNGYAGNHICKDGSVGGYGIWKMSGKNCDYVYKSINYEENYQFRVYDLNQVKIDESFVPKANDTYKAKLSSYVKNYGTTNDKNEILINVFAFGPGWSIEVKEGDKVLEVTRVSAADPLHIISYECQRLNVNADPTSDFITPNNSHMFKATATSATSTIEVKVTDRWGKSYTESVKRPKAFTTAMK